VSSDFVSRVVGSIRAAQCRNTYILIWSSREYPMIDPKVRATIKTITDTHDVAAS
jgi:hypothetical protein